jgi:hypothetical protein
MAIYHHSIKIISRGKGKSAVAAAAYRSGETITNEYDGVTHDYTRKGGIVHTEILLPENAPSKYNDRSVLWNAVERIEKAKNAQLAREIEIALPVELSAEQNTALVRDYCQRHFVAAGMCADICIHDKKDGNPHAHIMLTMRPITESGEWEAKSKKEYLTDGNGERLRLENGNFKTKKISATDWNEHTKAEEWRAAWAAAVNAALEQNGIAERVDHRSYARQGIEQIPAVHLGVAASQMERRGIRTERGNLNRQIEISNNEIRQTKARIGKLQKWLKSETKSAMPTLAGVLTEILGGGESKSRYGKIRDLKTAAMLLSFMQQNNITTMQDFTVIIGEFHGRLSDMREILKPIERRLKTLDEHIKQAGIITKHGAVYKKYNAQKQKDREAFMKSHHAEIILYEAADRYMKKNLNGRTQIPMKAWQSERMKLTTEKSSLNVKYQSLKDEIRDVEIVRKYAEQIARSAAPPKKTRPHDIEL